MKTITNRLVEQKGFTLIELMVALVIGSIITTALIRTFSLQLATQRFEDARRAAQMTARGTMSFIVRNLEQLGREPNMVLFSSANPALRAATATTISYYANLSTLWTDTDWSDSWEDVTFQYNAGSKTIDIVTGVGAPTPLTDGGAVQKSYVPSGGLAFTYFNGNGNVVAPGCALATCAPIRRVKVDITVRGKVPSGYTEPSVTLSQDVFLRNVS